MARCGRLGDRLRFFQLGAISMVLTPDFGEERELFDGRREGFGGSDPRGCVRRKLSNRKAVARRLPLGASMRVVLNHQTKQFLPMDILVLETMKDAVKCDT